MYNDIIDSDQFHNDEVHEGDLVFPGSSNSPHYVTVDREATAARNIGYIQENIKREAAYQERERKRAS